ncbi:MAG: GFA family protein [Labilithrix sp.]|nr:GFA family protein [Labilithrix sp.]MCW5813261.1 GFA family protein [Labilithrix sp.]
METKTKHTGGCHCGAVRYEALLEASHASRCNCTVCMKTGVLGGIIRPHELVVLRGEDALATYEWGAKTSKRYFCKHCGVHCFGRGHLAELGGDFASVNYLTLDEVDPIDVRVTYWDGRHDNWAAGPRDQPWALA